MGGVPSTPRRGARPADTAEELIAMFVGEKSYPISSEFWKKLLELPHTFQWPQERVEQACQTFLKNNYHTRHLAKILIHMVLSLQESLSATSGSSTHSKAMNAAYISSVFLKYIIENGKSGTFEELYLILSEIDMDKDVLLMGQSIENFVMQGVLNFIGKSDPSAHSYILHHELLNFILVAMSTLLRSGPCLGPKGVHRFIDAAMSQDGDIVASVVRRLLLNFIGRSSMPFSSHYTIYSNGNQSGVLQRVGSAAANIVLLPYYTFNYLVSSSGEGPRSPLADISLHVLLILVHYRTYVTLDPSMTITDAEHVDSEFCLKQGSCFYDNPYSKALNSASDIEFNRADIEGNAHGESLVRLPFASLFDTIGLFLFDESAVLLLYSFVHGNFAFLEYILVRTDLDILDVYLHTNCLAILANMAPHALRLSSYASQRLVSLFDMLARKYTKLVEIKNDKGLNVSIGQAGGGMIAEDMSSDLYIYAEFLRIVLEILNAILTYALPQNPEVVYAIMHRQEVFQPFKNHPKFHELLENVYTVLDFFNSRMDMQQTDGEWSVEKVLSVIIINCRSWHGDGMKIFTQLRFTYEQESHPEEFFIPYVWRLILGHSFTFNTDAINLFPVDKPAIDKSAGEEAGSV
ncbi:dymeclin isoform X2 [Phalaenopsis equestris]|uniref:dymeclin isoform X2 n=1 Tax=Phalaenopsis equestris TaxID=78828 RepID=UPI0009E5523F|nr:dymeclin isoform X2 [Phalaenopsis equestris]